MQLQWLFFQASGQGPYYGQLAWFFRAHEEKIPSAIERYKNEVRRVLGVLEGVLLKQPWLVGDKPTIADLSFITYVPGFRCIANIVLTSQPRWNDLIFERLVHDEVDLHEQYPTVFAYVLPSQFLERGVTIFSGRWHKKMNERAAVLKMREKKAAASA